MLKSYLKTALRNLRKYKEYSLINILGLAIGMACVILILLFVRDELSYDNFHVNRDRVYRVNLSTIHPETGAREIRGASPFRLAREMRIDFSDMPHIIRLMPQRRTLIEYGDKRFYEEGLYYADPDVFEVLTMPLLAGNPKTVLDDPFSVIITEDISHKFFGEPNALNKVLSFDGFDFKVTGILDKKPGNTQFEYEIIASTNCSDQVFPRIVLENWGEISTETYVLLNAGKKPEDYEDRLQAFVDTKLDSWTNFSPGLVLQPLSDLYLSSAEIPSFHQGGDVTYVYAFSAIALFILLIACINFMNLATARSANRAKEVGLRKVVGAQKPQLVGQFLSESVILSVLSLVVAILLTWLSLPFFNQLAGLELSVSILSDAPILLSMLAITLLVGIIAGSYPALFLSAFEPVVVLSGLLRRGLKAGALRRVLVTFQFAISIFLLIVTMVVYNQLEYARNMKLGFDREHLVLISGTPGSMRARYDQFRAELMQDPNIVNGSSSSRVPPGRLRSSLRARPEGVPEDQQEGMQTVWTDFEFIETMGFELSAGRSFSRQYPTDATSGFILNEAAVQKIGWTPETAIGKGFGSSEIKDWSSGQWEERNGQVIGVLKNFHFESLREEIVPTVYFVAPGMARNYVIRIKPTDIPQTLESIKKTWENFNPYDPFLYSFVDEEFDELYRNEERQGQIFSIFAVLAIFVACLGLVGLASFTAEQRTREVGIRKVLGASIGSVIVLISREFTWLVLVAFVVAGPVGWYFMGAWLQDFAYHVSLDISVFLIAGLVCLVVALLTVGYQATKVAVANPADALRYE